MDNCKSLVLEKVDSLRQEAVDLLSHLVQIPSISFNYPGIDQDEVRGGAGPLQCRSRISSGEDWVHTQHGCT